MQQRDARELEEKRSLAAVDAKKATEEATAVAVERLAS
jgi:hypothetical protein